jgi:hypothetical protein
MSIFNDTNNSINEILEMLKNYRTESRPNSSFQEATHTSTHPNEDSFARTHDASSHEEQPSRTHSTHPNPKPNHPNPTRINPQLRLHSSLEHMPKRAASR